MNRLLTTLGLALTTARGSGQDPTGDPGDVTGATAEGTDFRRASDLAH